MKTKRIGSFCIPVMITTVAMSAIAFAGCSQDDELDECENTYKTHAEMMMTRSGEGDLGGGLSTIKPYASGSTSVKTTDGLFSVTITWSRGYTTRAPYASLSANVTSSSGKCQNPKAEASWLGSSGIEGSVSYKEKRQRLKKDSRGNYVTDDRGNFIYEDYWANLSSSFTTTVTLVEVDDDDHGLH